VDEAQKLMEEAEALKKVRTNPTSLHSAQCAVHTPSHICSPVQGLLIALAHGRGRGTQEGAHQPHFPTLCTVCSAHSISYL